MTFYQKTQNAIITCPLTQYKTIAHDQYIKKIMSNLQILDQKKRISEIHKRNKGCDEFR